MCSHRKSLIFTLELLHGPWKTVWRESWVTNKVDIDLTCFVSLNILETLELLLHMQCQPWTYGYERHSKCTGEREKKGNTDFNLLSWTAVFWVLIKPLPDDLGFLLGDQCSTAAVAFMLNPSVETPLIVGLAHRSPPLFILSPQLCYMTIQTAPDLRSLL